MQLNTCCVDCRSIIFAGNYVNRRSKSEIEHGDPMVCFNCTAVMVVDANVAGHLRPITSDDYGDFEPEVSRELEKLVKAAEASIRFQSHFRGGLHGPI